MKKFCFLLRLNRPRFWNSSDTKNLWFIMYGCLMMATASIDFPVSLRFIQTSMQNLHDYSRKDKQEALAFTRQKEVLRLLATGSSLRSCPAMLQMQDSAFMGRTVKRPAFLPHCWVFQNLSLCYFMEGFKMPFNTY